MDFNQIIKEVIFGKGYFESSVSKTDLDVFRDVIENTIEMYYRKLVG